MAFPCCSMLLILLCSLVSLSSSLANTPKQLFLPVYKDAATLQYVTQIKQRTPLVPVRLTVDLGGRYLWTVCEKGYNSTTIRPAGCQTNQCRLAHAATSCFTCTWGKYGPGCTEADTCWRYPRNSVTYSTSLGEVASDIVAINTLHGNGRAGNVVTVPRFIFLCSDKLNVKGLAKGVVGMAGLGRTAISFPAQLASALNLKRRFGLCLSSSTTSKHGGFVIIGDGPYNINGNSSTLLKYTSLILNKKTTGEEQIVRGETAADYFIGVKSIKINNKTVKLNNTLLKIKSGYGGTKISTVNPYTVLETTIYGAVIKAFVNEFKNVTRVPAVAPFGACFSSKNIGSTKVGPDVPTIDLVMEENGVVWKMFGSNSMVRVNKDVLCLGFVDGGEATFITPTSIVIGGHQLEENLLTFDLDKSRLGFSSSLLSTETTCSSYKVVSDAWIDGTSV